MENYFIFELMYNEKVIEHESETRFEEMLQVHQKVLSTSGEYQLLQERILEHNIAVVSNIYTNISFKSLGRFLGISPGNAEKLISTMVKENRIEAVLDQ